MANRTSYRVDFPEGEFARVSSAAERLGLDLGDLLAIAAAIAVAALGGSVDELKAKVSKRRRPAGSGM